MHFYANTACKALEVRLTGQKIRMFTCPIDSVEKKSRKSASIGQLSFEECAENISKITKKRCLSTLIL